jgi:RimJ/RimL family protein N-acetyltransferase
MDPIERLTPVHAAPYRALMLEAYARHPDAFTSSAAERTALPLSWWEARLSNGHAPPEMVFGAFIDGQLSGVAGLSFEPREKTRHKATLFGMYVPLPARQHGLGKRLIRVVLDEAAARPGIELMQLTVSQGNTAAQALYERCGFVTFGLEPLAVRVDAGYVAKVHMWRRVRQATDGM